MYILGTREEHTQRAGEGSRHGCFIGQANEASPDVREADTGRNKRDSRMSSLEQQSTVASILVSILLPSPSLLLIFYKINRAQNGIFIST